MFWKNLTRSTIVKNRNLKSRKEVKKVESKLKAMEEKKKFMEATRAKEALMEAKKEARRSSMAETHSASFIRELGVSSKADIFSGVPSPSTKLDGFSDFSTTA